MEWTIRESNPGPILKRTATASFKFSLFHYIICLHWNWNYIRLLYPIYSEKQKGCMTYGTSLCMLTLVLAWVLQTKWICRFCATLLGQAAILFFSIGICTAIGPKLKEPTWYTISKISLLYILINSCNIYVVKIHNGRQTAILFSHGQKIKCAHTRPY